LAVFRQYENLLVKVRESHQTKCDRRLKWLKISRLILLIISSLTTAFLPKFCNSQVSNQLAFEELVLHRIAKSGYKIDSLNGFATEKLREEILLDSSVNRSLSIEEPTIIFQPVGNRKFVRNIETVLNFRDTAEVGILISFKDTVDSKLLPSLRKSKYPELRGDSPRVISKYIGPALLIGTGIAGIILLFYLRS
jgi:hypothetical protein